MQYFRLLLVTLLVALLSACATRMQMAFEDEKQVVSEAGKPIFLLTVTLRNTYKESYQPHLLVAHIEKSGATDASGRFNFKMDEKARNETDALPEGNSYLLRMELEPGKYDFVGLSSFVKSFPLYGTFFTPVHAQLVASAGGVYYLGHIDANVRERKDNEFRAGGPLPLIDQSIVGASGGTFDVEITDALTKDGPAFKARFPALANVQIKPSILPPFDRAKAQQRWEAN